MSQHPIINYHYSKFADLILLSELILKRNILVYPNYYETLGLVFLGNNYKEASESQVLKVLDLVNVRNFQECHHILVVVKNSLYQICSQTSSISLYEQHGGFQTPRRFQLPSAC